MSKLLDASVLDYLRLSLRSTAQNLQILSPDKK
jgi:hypothetical protein